MEEVANKPQRYLVLKLSDIDKYLSEETRADLARIESCIDASRVSDKKQPVRCVVIEAGADVDEPTFRSLEAVVDNIQEPLECPALQH